MSESLDLDLWALSFGGEVAYQANNKIFARMGAGIVFNVANWDAKRSDVLYQSINGEPSSVAGISKSSSSGTELLVGIYSEAAVGYQVTQAFSVEANVRHDWNESLDDTVGNSSFEADLSGLSIGFGANYTF